ncbi:hypothetical protein ABRG53_2194 [Pseudanabaena sp. ABRG5-3]|nr:hypothetical protein ABRG53_2194 [Pseudanabaena sp. ABRG5-3]
MDSLVALLTDGFGLVAVGIFVHAEMAIAPTKDRVNSVKKAFILVKDLTNLVMIASMKINVG